MFLLEVGFLIRSNHTKLAWQQHLQLEKQSCPHVSKGSLIFIYFISFLCIFERLGKHLVVFIRLTQGYFHNSNQLLLISRIPNRPRASSEEDSAEIAGVVSVWDHNAILLILSTVRAHFIDLSDVTPVLPIIHCKIWLRLGFPDTFPHSHDK